MPERAIRYLRDQAEKLRELADGESEPVRKKLLALAVRCEALANSMEGNGGHRSV